MEACYFGLEHMKIFRTTFEEQNNEPGKTQDSKLYPDDTLFCKSGVPGL